MNMTAAIAGLGAAAQKIHLPACRQVDGIRLVAGCDPAPTSLKLPFPCFGSVQEMLRQSRPEILVVAAPPSAHFELVRAGLLAGCHVLCEKPFAETLQEADQLIELAEKQARWVVVNNQFRFMNIYRTARGHIGSPQFGELLFVSAEQTFFTSQLSEAGWRGRESRRTCKDFGIHVLDLCRFFFDQEPLWVQARMPRAGRPDAADYLNLIDVAFPGDRMARVTLDRLCRGRHRYLDLRLDGTQGSVETHLGGEACLSLGMAGRPVRPFARLNLSPGGQAVLCQGERVRKIASEPFNGFARATARLLEAFLKALQEQSEPPCSARDNRASLALMLAAYDSHRKGAPVELSHD